jgi:putative pyruvate formate lyase activating enzyme
MIPSYVRLHERGELRQRAEALRELLEECCLCPRQCGARRLNGETGVCRTGALAVYSSSFAHFGEESPLVGRRGSGTIFFTHCNLMCSFCQNYDISHEGEGREVSASRLADLMLMLQESGCHNINVVTPTHVTPQIVEALALASDGGLQVPVVYNCGGYESLRTLELLDGIVDIYMPDFKFWDAKTGERFTGVPDYPQRAREALGEMHRQVGDLVLDDGGIAQRGILLRHLVMPDGLAGTRDIMRFVAREISKNTYVNIMPQYRPCGEVHGDSDAGRRITGREFRDAIEAALEEGIERLDERKLRVLIL